MTEHCPYHVGQRVTPCVLEIPEWAKAKGICADGVYTISAIGPQPLAKDRPNSIVLWLKEAPNINIRGKDLGWYWRRFRPVTDISSLEALLVAKPAPAPTPEPVS